jgi:hypothetical protein
MANHFDKILKENLEEIFLPLAEVYLNIKIVKSKNLREKFQKTIEREPDSLKIIETADSQKFILQIEFQTQDDLEMPYRMAEYHAFLTRKYKMEVRQLVIFLGEKSTKMTNQLPPEHQHKGFRLVSFSQRDYHELLSSNVPEELILTILCMIPEEDLPQILSELLTKLNQLSGNNVIFEKYLFQLATLSKIRKFSPQIIKLIEDMPVTWEPQYDAFYLKGVEKGMEKGIEKGTAMIASFKESFVKKLVLLGLLTDEQIAEMAEVDLTFVQKIKKTIKK